MTSVLARPVTYLLPFGFAVLLGACGSGGTAPSSAAPAKPEVKSSAAGSIAPAASVGVAAGGSICQGSAKPDPQNCAAAPKVTADPNLGNVLTDDRGNTLYNYDDPASAAGKDPMSCPYGPILGRGGLGVVNACLGAWPPVISAEMPATPAGLIGQLAVVTRADLNNTKQVTYNGAPLYYFLGDRATPGSTNGNGVKAFGGAWQVVKVG